MNKISVKIYKLKEFPQNKVKTNQSQIKPTQPIISQTTNASIHEKTLTPEPNSNDESNQLNSSDMDLNRTLITSTPMVPIIEETVTLSQNDSILQEINLNNVSKNYTI